MNSEDRRSNLFSNDIKDGIFLHAVIQGRDITLQLPRNVQPALSGLPARSPGFTGRDHDLSAVMQFMDPANESQNKSATILLSGLGGVGKTELASQVAYTVRGANDWFPGGVIFVDLFGYDRRLSLSPERALTSLLQAIGVPEESVPEDLQSRIRLHRSILAAYAERGARILLILDNASSADQVRDLLPTDGINFALVTSRHTLSIGARLYELKALDPEASIRLLRSSIAVSRGEEDERIDEDVDSSHALSRLCGNLPLALQICAAILADSPRRPVSSLVESLNKSHSRIDELRREDKAVRAVFDLSYELLTESERRVLGFASFSPGPDISTAAAARLVDVPEGEVERTLIGLSRAHLVEEGNTWGRWRLHDLVRLYALEAVADLAGQGEAVARLYEFYLDRSREAARILGVEEATGLFASRDSALEWFDAEYRNLIETVYVAANQPELLAYAAEIPHRLARYLDIRCLYNDWKEVMEASLSTLEDYGHEHYKANALNSLGMVSRELHQLSSSIAFHEQAISIARNLDDDIMLAKYLNGAGNAFYDNRDFESALDAHSEAAEIFARKCDYLGFARATDNSASALRMLKRTGDALPLHEEAIRIFREAGIRESEARSLSHMGCTLFDLGRIGESVIAHKEAIEMFRRLELRGPLAKALVNLSNSLRECGDMNGALDSIDESLSVHSALDDQVSVARTLNQRGLVYSDLGDFDQAVASFNECLDLLHGYDDLIEVGYAFANLGRLHGMNMRPTEGIHFFKEASVVFARCNASDDLATVRQMIWALSLAVP
ncbi:ATP-binding protein [Streptomyces sp. NPDC060209]|uniref:ATP-binding protein n=1 Tax=Streptomyces sp. NPDC060209 TaxID=3347073 RepID=UPI00364D7E5A